MVILIGIGAGLGAVCRYGITVLGKMLWPGKPLAPLLINVLGSLLAGLLVGLPALWRFVCSYCRAFAVALRPFQRSWQTRLS